MNTILKFDQWFARRVARLTTGFVKTTLGQWFLNLALVGPLTFVPTAWGAWTAPNIDALRTLTWPSMVIINVSILVSLCHQGEWRLRLSMIAWIVLMSLVWLATIVR